MKFYLEIFYSQNSENNNEKKNHPISIKWFTKVAK